MVISITREETTNMLLTVKDARQVDIQGYEVRRDELAVHESQITTTESILYFGDTCVRDLKRVRAYLELCNVMA